jgi:hypothetical protein
MLQAEMQRLQQQQEALLAEREAERAEREAERERMQALEAQTQGLLAFVQQLEEQQGWQIPAQLLAPPRPPPPPHRESTPVSMSMIVLLSVLMLCVKRSVGLRARFVDLSAFMPEMWLSAFVSTFFLQVLETSPCRGGAAEIFNFSLHLGFLSCYSRAISFYSAALGGVVEPCRRVAGVARRGIPSRSIAGIPVAVSRPQTRFYLLHLRTWNNVYFCICGLYVYFWICGLYVYFSICGLYFCALVFMYSGDIWPHFWMCPFPFINVVCEILKFNCDLYKYMLYLSHGKAKEKKRKKRKKRKGPSPSAWAPGIRGREN